MFRRNRQTRCVALVSACAGFFRARPFLLEGGFDVRLSSSHDVDQRNDFGNGSRAAARNADITFNAVLMARLYFRTSDNDILH